MKLRKDTVIKVLNTIYDNAVKGLPGVLSVEEEVQKEWIGPEKRTVYLE